MVYAVQGMFGFRNTARRDGVMQNVQTRLEQEVIWGETVTTPIDRTDPELIVEVRFTTDAARDSFWTDVIGFLGTGINGPIVGSYIYQHDCPHDEEDSAGCVIGERIDY